MAARSKSILWPVVNCALIVLVVIHGLAFASVAPRPAGASADPGWPGLVLCRHGADRAAIAPDGLPPLPADSTGHCDVCFAGVAHILIPLPFSPQHILIAVTEAPAPSTDLPRACRGAGDPSARPRGPPLTA